MKEFASCGPLSRQSCASCLNCRKLYWTEDGSGGNGKARIAQANLDGSEVSTLYGDVVRPTGLGIEFGLKEDRYDVAIVNCVSIRCLFFGNTGTVQLQ